MDETARPRRITKQRPAHSVGTPRRGLATNTGPLAAAAWLAERGVSPEHEKWFVEVRLHAQNDPSTCFQLDVYAEEWGFQLQHDGRNSWIRVTDTPFVHGRDDFDLFGRVRALRDIGRVLQAVENELGLAFDRGAPGIRTNLADAYPSVRAWIAAL